jgi:thioredoxin 1
MNRYLFLLFTLTIVFVNSCSNGQSKTFNLSPLEFSKKITDLPNAPIVDIRTSGEFANGHIEKSVNVDWKSENFESQISQFDKAQPILIYCLSGGRSAAAANKMRSMGFKEVYELNGGMMKWRAANFPETTSTNSNTSKGMSKQEFDQILNTDKMVLFDFYAEWCGPCKKMKPYLEEISKEMADKVQVVRIDVDANKELSNELKIDGLPTLLLYKNKSLAWKNEHYISKEDIVKHLK